MERLIELRKQQNLTQQDMARILGISRQAYSNYELGNREADYTTLKKLSNYFNVTVDYLLGETSTRPTLSLVAIALDVSIDWLVSPDALPLPTDVPPCR